MRLEMLMERSIIRAIALVSAETLLTQTNLMLMT